jgi:hypothetical protein
MPNTGWQARGRVMRFEVVLLGPIDVTEKTTGDVTRLAL